MSRYDETADPWDRCVEISYFCVCTLHHYSHHDLRSKAVNEHVLLCGDHCDAIWSNPLNS